MRTAADRKFLKYVQSHVREYGVKLVWGKGKELNCDGYRAPAFFDETKRMMKVAKNNPRWFVNLIHEYAHFLQWIDGIAIFRKSDAAVTIVDEWFSGKEYAELKLKKAFAILREMERDCEKRVIALIERFGLSIDKRKYTKDANLYIYSHFIMEDTRKFYAYKRSPYKSTKILREIADTFKVKSHKHIPKYIHKILTELTIR